MSQHFVKVSHQQSDLELNQATHAQTPLCCLLPLEQASQGQRESLNLPLEQGALESELLGF